MRAAPADAASPLELAEFPMAPYVNRIARGRFRWRGETIALPRNFGDHPHPLHGTGWQSQWTCERLDAAQARMSLRAGACAAWPWAIAVERLVTLTGDAMEIATTLTNADARPMPASVGSHPYFPAAGASVQLSAGAQMLTTEEGIPLRAERTAAVDALARGAEVSGLALDHCFTGWDGAATLAWPGLTLHMETDPPLRFAQVYAPRGADFFCVEPMTAAPDSVNQGGAADLAAGDSLRARVRFRLGRRL